MWFRKFCIAYEERCGFSEELACRPMCFLFGVLPQDHRVFLVNKCIAQVNLLGSKLLWYRKDYFLKISYTIAGKADSSCLKINVKDWETTTKNPIANT